MKTRQDRSTSTSASSSGLTSFCDRDVRQLTAPGLQIGIGGDRRGEDWDSVGTRGTTNFGDVELQITRADLVRTLDPGFDKADADIALEASVESDSIHRVAQLEFLNGRGGEPPILQTAADFRNRR